MLDTLGPMLAPAEVKGTCLGRHGLSIDLQEERRWRV